MGCLRLTYAEDETLFLEQEPEKVEPLKLEVWVNPEREFLGVDDVVAGNGGPGDPPANGPLVLQAGFGDNEHLLGPTLILLGQPMLDKRFVMKGATQGTSIASKTLSKAIPQTFTKTLGTQVGTKVATTVGTNVIGRFLGRLVPYVGWGLTAYDVWDNRVIIGEFLEGMKETNQQNSYKKDGTWSTEWHVR